MILTETLFRKIISFAVHQETQFHADLMAQASAVLKRAHKRGVELEYILEVSLVTWHLPDSKLPTGSRLKPRCIYSCDLPRMTVRLSGTQHRVTLSASYFLFIFG